MADKKEGVGTRFMNWVKNNHAQQPKLGAEIRAWTREGAKDLWNAIVPAFPDSARSMDEQGTPLNPTPQNVTQDLGNFHGYAPEEYVRPQTPDNDRSKGHSR